MVGIPVVAASIRRPFELVAHSACLDRGFRIGMDCFCSERDHVAYLARDTPSAVVRAVGDILPGGHTKVGHGRF